MQEHRIRQAALALAATAAVCAVHQATAFAQGSGDEEVDRFLRRYQNEPNVREVQLAAIRYYNVSPERIASLRGRTRSKALVPGVTVGFTNSLSSWHMGVDDIIFRNTGELARIEDQSADYKGFTASLAWGLDRLVFNAEELDVMSLIGIQDGIQREVTTLYYVRRRLQIEQLLNPPSTVAARIAAELRLEELSGLLDEYTGGYFSKQIGKAKKR
jgi:hypothetical protein